MQLHTDYGSIRIKIGLSAFIREIRGEFSAWFHFVPFVCFVGGSVRSGPTQMEGGRTGTRTGGRVSASVTSAVLPR
jgi:hypothetical protein